MSMCHRGVAVAVVGVAGVLASCESSPDARAQSDIDVVLADTLRAPDVRPEGEDLDTTLFSSNALDSVQGRDESVHTGNIEPLQLLERAMLHEVGACVFTAVTSENIAFVLQPVRSRIIGAVDNHNSKASPFGSAPLASGPVVDLWTEIATRNLLGDWNLEGFEQFHTENGSFPTLPSRIKQFRLCAPLGERNLSTFRDAGLDSQKSTAVIEHDEGRGIPERGFSKSVEHLVKQAHGTPSFRVWITVPTRWTESTSRLITADEAATLPQEKIETSVVIDPRTGKELERTTLTWDHYEQRSGYWTVILGVYLEDGTTTARYLGQQMFDGHLVGGGRDSARTGIVVPPP